jgi:hypothetical protein
VTDLPRIASQSILISHDDQGVWILWRLIFRRCHPPMAVPRKTQIACARKFGSQSISAGQIQMEHSLDWQGMSQGTLKPHRQYLIFLIIERVETTPDCKSALINESRSSYVVGPIHPFLYEFHSSLLSTPSSTFGKLPPSSDLVFREGGE